MCIYIYIHTYLYTYTILCLLVDKEMRGLSLSWLIPHTDQHESPTIFSRRTPTFTKSSDIFVGELGLVDL